MQDKMRRLFLQTGNVEAYLLLKRFESDERKTPYFYNISKRPISLKPHNK